MQERTTTDGRGALIAAGGAADPRRVPSTPAAQSSIASPGLSPAAGVHLPRFRCEELARRGTGVGSCDLPLDEHGYCSRPSAHLDIA